MKYNEKYDRYVTKGGLVYRYDKKRDRLVQCRLFELKTGYLIFRVSKPKFCNVYVHRLVYETFVGEIPSGYEIDHINTIRNDNRLGNLRSVTHLDNMRNPLTLDKFNGNNWNRNKILSEFGRKFKEHFGITKSENPKLYCKENSYFHRHNKKCSWEK